MRLPSLDAVHRTALLNAHNDRYSTLEEALHAHSATGAAIVVDSSTLAEDNGQAAVCTAIATATRAFGTALILTDALCPITVGPHSGRILGEAVRGEGARLIRELSAVPGDWPVLVIGVCPSYLEADLADRAIVLRTSWTGWTARVTPRHQPTYGTDDFSGNVLTAIAAAALAVHEAFGAIQDQPGSDAGHRTAAINLWRPGEKDGDGPRLSWAPASWWLVGLGHLGQANSWVLSYLPYVDRSKILVVLQDDDVASDANHSTGLLTAANPDIMRKTRIIAPILDSLGFTTYINELRLDAKSRSGDRADHVALLGVDNLATRRLISDMEWNLAIDAGLGSGASDFNDIVIRRFPGSRRSDEVPAWVDRPESAAQIRNRVFEDAVRRDACGAVELGGTAVGATFVGAIAACLAVAEAVRPLHGGVGYDVLSAHLGPSFWDTAPSDIEVDVVPARLV